MIKSIILSSIVFMALALSFTSCKKVDCDALVNAIKTGADAYKLAQSPTNCLNYRKAIQAWLDESDCSDENAVQTNIYRSTLATLTATCP